MTIWTAKIKEDKSCGDDVSMIYSPEGVVGMMKVYSPEGGCGDDEGLLTRGGCGDDEG